MAQRCLDLVPEKEGSEALQAYRDMLTALGMLAEFGVSILPIVVSESKIGEIFKMFVYICKNRGHEKTRLIKGDGRWSIKCQL